MVEYRQNFQVVIIFFKVSQTEQEALTQRIKSDTLNTLYTNKLLLEFIVEQINS